MKKQYLNKINLVVLFLSLMMLWSGCKKENTDPVIPEPEEPEAEVIVAENTKMMDETTRNLLVSFDTINYSFSFNGSSQLLSNLKPGDILVDSVSAKAPYGYLRKVKTISSQKDGMQIIETEQATLTEAVNKGSIRFNTGQLKMEHLRYYELADGVVLNSAKGTDFQVFSFDYQQAFTTPTGSVTVSGHTELNMDFFFDFDWDFEWLPPHPIVKKFETGVEINQNASIMVVSENGVSMDQRISLGKFYFVPWTFTVGPIPVVFVPQIELFVEMNGQISAEITTSASENFTGRIGSQYTEEQGWNKIAEKTYNTDFVAPQITMDASFTTHVGPEIALLLYGVAGPFVNVTGCGQIAASLYVNTGNWDLDFIVGAQAKVGVKIDILGLTEPWEESFCLFQEVLLSLNNEPFGNHLYISTPINDQTHLVGDPLLVTTRYTGETPEKVDFYVDYALVFSDTEEPFEYEWNTTDFAQGIHYVRAESWVNNSMADEDIVGVNFVIPEWDLLNLENSGLSATSLVTDIQFINTSEGWMSVADNQKGKILATTDAGNTWNMVYESGKPIEQQIFFNNQGNGIMLDQSGDVWETTNGGQSYDILSYGQFGQPSFQWKEIFELATNNSGEIVAVGKDEGIPYHFRIYRANIASHTPTGYFEVPWPNEYGSAPRMVMNQNNGFLYEVFDEDHPNNYHYMTTSDGGVSWEAHQFEFLNQNSHLYDAFMPDENHIWFVGEENGNALVVFSDNGGASWVKSDFVTIPAFGSVHFISDETGYATIKESTEESSAKVYKTVDGGHNWAPMIETTSVYGMSEVFFLGEDFGVIGGCGPSVFRYSISK